MVLGMWQNILIRLNIRIFGRNPNIRIRISEYSDIRPNQNILPHPYAYDTVDKKILADKMEYYGIKDNELSIVKSFLRERSKIVEINKKRSPFKKSNACSVIQGSKLSSFLYIQYTNKIPLLRNMLDDEEWVE